MSSRPTHTIPSVAAGDATRRSRPGDAVLRIRLGRARHARPGRVDERQREAAEARVGVARREDERPRDALRERAVHARDLVRRARGRCVERGELSVLSLCVFAVLEREGGASGRRRRGGGG